MRLHARVGRIVHEHKEAGDYTGVKLLLKDGRKVCRHLTDGVAASVSDPEIVWHLCALQKINVPIGACRGGFRGKGVY